MTKLLILLAATGQISMARPYLEATEEIGSNVLQKIVTSAIQDDSLVSRRYNTFASRVTSDSIFWMRGEEVSETNTFTFYDNGMDAKLFVKVGSAWKKANAFFYGFISGPAGYEPNVEPANASYVWYKNGTLIPGATSRTYKPTLTADYSVHVTWSNGALQPVGIYTTGITVSTQPPITGVGSYQQPLDSVIINKKGADLSLIFPFAEDSVQWTIKDVETNLVTNSQAKNITLYGDAQVTVMAKQGRAWYKQNLSFKGIVFDTYADILHAPIILNAQYAWYFNGQLIDVTSPSYTPTQAGTYKVVITWTESGNANSRIEAVSKTAVYSFQVTQSMITGLNDSNESSATMMGVYPNPAVGFVTITNLEGSFAYSICSVNGNEVAKGQSVANSSIDISGLEAGVYMMNIKTQVSQVTKRIIVK